MPFNIDPDVEDAVFEEVQEPSSPEKGNAKAEFAKQSVVSGILKRVGYFVRAVGEEVSPSMAVKARDAGRQPGFSWRL